MKFLFWLPMGMEVGTSGGGTGVLDRFCVDTNDGGGVDGSSIFVTLID